MTTITINLNEISRVQTFVNTLSKIHINFDVKSRHYLVDAKSIMGLLSLDLSRPVDLIIHSNDETIVNYIKNELVEMGAI